MFIEIYKGFNIYHMDDGTYYAVNQIHNIIPQDIYSTELEEVFNKIDDILMNGSRY